MYIDRPELPRSFWCSVYSKGGIYFSQYVCCYNHILDVVHHVVHHHTYNSGWKSTLAELQADEDKQEYNQCNAQLLLSIHVMVQPLNNTIGYILKISPAAPGPTWIRCYFHAISDQSYIHLCSAVSRTKKEPDRLWHQHHESKYTVYQCVLSKSAVIPL